MRVYKPYSNTPYSQRRKNQKKRKNLFLSIILGIFLIYAFINWIMPVFVGGLSVLDKFKSIPTKSIPISESVILAPPVLNIPYEATATASIFVSGYTIANHIVEIYNNNSKVSSTQADNDGLFKSETFRLQVGQNSIHGKTVDNQGNSSLASKKIDLLYVSEKPKLEVSSPTEGQIITGDKKVTVSGNTNPNNSIFINSIKVIVSANGSFNQTISIDDNENIITISAIDNVGQTTQVSRKVIYQP